MLVKKVEERSIRITCKGKVGEGFQDNMVSKKSKKRESRRKEWRIDWLEGDWETVAEDYKYLLDLVKYISLATFCWAVVL